MNTDFLSNVNATDTVQAVTLFYPPALSRTNHIGNIPRQPIKQIPVVIFSSPFRQA